MHRIPSGFSLVELLVVMAVMGILAAALMPLAEISMQRNREQELRRDLWELRDAIDAFKHAGDLGEIAVPVGTSGYPPDLHTLVAGVPDLKNAGRQRVFLRSIQRDPFASELSSAEKSWGLRSYDSSAERPRPGDDVYDVFSRSTKVGLNGIPLSKW